MVLFIQCVRTYEPIFESSRSPPVAADVSTHPLRPLALPLFDVTATQGPLNALFPSVLGSN
jgi:hypothetical protein